jgi:spore maturation protein CgeB
MRIHLVHPGVNWSLSDVFDGLRDGLLANGVEIVPEKADADWIVVVNGNLHDPEKLRGWRMLAPVAVLCTESPYDFEQEVERIAVVDGGWTHECESLAPLQAVNPRVSYLPHAWHPERHRLSEPDPSVPAHDVVFVGTGFNERVEWFNKIDWSGINLGIYGLWAGLGLEAHIMRDCVYPKYNEEDDVYAEAQCIANAQTVALYRRAKMGLNLYRRRGGGMGFTPKHDVAAVSLNPRAYELAACGVFHVSTPRPEVTERFGALVPLIGGTRETAAHDEAVIRDWLARDADRAAIAAQLPASVAGESWIERAASVLHDLRTWSTVTV